MSTLCDKFMELDQAAWILISLFTTSSCINHEYWIRYFCDWCFTSNTSSAWKQNMMTSLAAIVLRINTRAKVLLNTATRVRLEAVWKGNLNSLRPGDVSANYRWTARIFQCSRKTFMVHQTFVRWALYILFKFVKSLIRHLGLAIGNVRHVRWFSWTLIFIESGNGLLSVQQQAKACTNAHLLSGITRQNESRYKQKISWRKIYFQMPMVKILAISLRH